jgi:hypothetical protein
MIMRKQGLRRDSRPLALVTALLAVCLSVVVTCSSLDGGFGSETTNGRVSGRVVLPDGSPAQGVHFIVRRDDYLASPQSALVNPWVNGGDGTTDTGGRFVFDSLDTGNYFIEFNNLNVGALLKNGSIAAARLSVDVGTDTLRSHATVKGEINIDAAPGAAWYVQVYGLERCVAIGPTGTYTLGDLPAGTFRLRFVCGDSSVVPLTLDGVTAAAGATTAVPSVGWKYSRQLALNTTASGANVAGPVYRFPLLVRLTEGVNFTFSQARKKGEDVRFLTPDKKVLPYEIERWDSAGGRAELWVRLDTVFGSNGTQYITMQWGNGKAKSNSNGAAVFDTADGCIAVWHLNRNCNDAGYNNHNGVASSASDTTGAIGFCKKFSGSDSIEMAGLLGSPSSVTLSAWAQLDSTSPDGGSEILSIGDAALIRMDYALDSVGTIGSIHLSGTSIFNNASSGQFLKKTGWHLLTFTVNRNNYTQTLYIDGTNVCSITKLNATINYSSVGQNTYIGKHANGKTGFDFSGRIDEVRAYRAPVSADYIKLCYMNQKAQDALIIFK